MKCNLLCLIVALLSITGYSQVDSTELIIYATPSSYYRIKINGELQPVTNKIQLKPGKYKISIWAPNYKQLDTTIVLGSNKLVLKKKLKRTDELIALQNYEATKSQYNTNMILWSSTAALSGVGAIINYQRLERFNLEVVKNQYRAEYTPLTGNGSHQLLAAKSNLKNARILQASFYSISAIACGLLIKNYLEKSKLEVPKLIKNNAFEMVDIGIAPLQGGAMGIIKINLASK